MGKSRPPCHADRMAREFSALWGRLRRHTAQPVRLIKARLEDRRWRSAICAGMLIVAAVAIPLAAWPRSDGLLQVEPNEIGWIRTAYRSELRRPIVGETILTASQLPRDSATVQLIYRFETEGRPRAPYVIRFPAIGGTFLVHINSAPIFTDPVEGPTHFAHSGLRPAVVGIDAEYFHATRNRIDILVSGARTQALAGGFAFGPASEHRANLAPVWGLDTGFGALTFILAASGFLILLTSPLGRDTRNRTIFAITLLALALKSAALAPAAMNWLSNTWVVFDRSCLAAAIVCTALILPGPDAGKRRVFTAGLVVAAIVMAAALAAAFMSTRWALTLSFAGLGLALFILGLRAATLLRHVRATSPFQSVSASLACITALLVVVASAGETWPPAVLTVERSLTLAIALLACAAAIDAGRLIARASLHAAREGINLSALVQRQRLEIEEKSRALETETRRRTLAEERQRLVRDMHDGVGGQLISLLARVRGGRLNQEEIEAELRTGLQDLRLIVDSMDSAGSSLENALRQFHDRARLQTEASGVVLNWQQNRPAQVELSEPRAILNIFRWLQEALTNALRHSGAKTITISVDHSARAVRISVADDGCGMPVADSPPASGHGLSNMASRARELGGSFGVEPVRPSGTRLVLELDPARLTAIGAPPQS